MKINVFFFIKRQKTLAYAFIFILNKFLGFISLYLPAHLMRYSVRSGTFVEFTLSEFRKGDSISSFKEEY